MTKTLTEIQRESDARRGMVTKAFKMPKELADTIANLAKERGIPQNQVIAEAVAMYDQAAPLP